MRLVTLLHRDVERALLRDCIHHLHVEHLCSFEQLNAALASLETAVVVLEPLCLSDRAFDRFLTAAESSTARVLFLADMNAASARRIVQAAARQIGDVIFADGDDIVPLLAIKLLSVNEVPASTMVLRALSVEVSALPHPVSVHSIALFSGARVPRDVSCFARRMKVPRRSLHRELTRVGLASASNLLAVARLARTWEHVGRAQTTEASFVPEDFPSYRGLYTQYVRLVGLPPRRAAHDISVDEFASRLARSARADEQDSRAPCH
jgi:hypothetical protein